MMQASPIDKCESFLSDLMQSVSVIADGKGSQPIAQTGEETFIRLLLNLKQARVPIQCKVCDSSGIEGTARAFISSNPLTITLCANRLTEKTYKDALVHEATHAYDFIHDKCDFATCEGLAYSEVRAARNAECATSWKFTKRSCVRAHAISATSHIFPKQAKACVVKVLDAALVDNSPT